MTPEVVATLAGDRSAELVWRNELGGLTFRIDGQFLKWNPRRTGIDLELERARRSDRARHWMTSYWCTDACAPNTLISGTGEWTRTFLDAAWRGGHTCGGGF